MKKTILLSVFALIITSLCAQVLITSKKKRKEHDKSFSVNDDIVYYNLTPLAKYQAKTYSLDGGELVEEYNLLLIDNKISNKQLIGDLIDFVSDRHQGAEVEVEIEGKNSIFNL